MIQIVYLLILIMITCCNPEKKNNDLDVIAYGTQAFELFEKKAAIKKEEAWKLVLDYCNLPNDEKFIIYPKLFFIVNNNYVFTFYFNPKVPESNITGVYVNAETGEVTYHKDTRKFWRMDPWGWRGEIK